MPPECLAGEGYNNKESFSHKSLTMFEEKGGKMKQKETKRQTKERIYVNKVHVEVLTALDCQ